MDEVDIPLFLLNVVLHSGGRMELRVFEPRYMDMVKECLRTNTPFGVCLIAQGSEVAGPAGFTSEPRAVGTLASIADWQMPQLGILHVVTHGGQRFRILSWRREKSGLVRARAVLLPDPPVLPVPGDYARLVPMLRSLIESLEEPPPKPHRFYDAAWVADRWAEFLPLPLEKHQAILELDDGIARLEVIYRFLEEEV